MFTSPAARLWRCRDFDMPLIKCAYLARIAAETRRLLLLRRDHRWAASFTRAESGALATLVERPTGGSALRYTCFQRAMP